MHLCAEKIWWKNSITFQNYGLDHTSSSKTTFDVSFFLFRYDAKMAQTEARMRALGLLTPSCVLTLDEWEIPRDRVVINRKLGEGAFGTVYGGEAFFDEKGWVSHVFWPRETYLFVLHTWYWIARERWHFFYEFNLGRQFWKNSIFYFISLLSSLLLLFLSNKALNFVNTETMPNSFFFCLVLFESN